MPKDTQLSDLAVNTQGDALGALVDGGFIDVMDGRKAASGDEEVTTQRVLVTMTFGKPAFRPSASGILSANGITAGVATLSGEPSWFRAYRADHKTGVLDGTAGTKDANMILPAKTIVEGVTVGCSGLTHSVVKSMAGI